MLSKSLFLAGCKCPKKLWLAIHQPELRVSPGLNAKERMRVGLEVGELARQMFPEGVVATPDPISGESAVQRTLELLRGGCSVIFEAAFESDGLLAKVDILLREADGWRVLEVKSSTKRRSEHEEDVAFQVLVLRRCGLAVKSAELVLVDRDYVWDGGRLVAEQFLRREDVTTHVEDLQPRTELQAASFLKLWSLTDYPDSSGSTPHVDPGLHGACRDCDFGAHCTERAAPNDIFYLGLHQSRLAKLRRDGVHSINAVPDDFLTNPVERLRLRSHRLGRSLVHEAIAEDLEAIAYPAYLIDFETVSPATPLLPGTRPYQSLPFQWSCHKLDSQDSLGRLFLDITHGHSGFLHREASDPREAFVSTLLERLSEGGSILHYSSFELNVLRNLVSAGIPRADELLKAVDGRLIDLQKIVRDRYAHPAFKGLSSIKVVLPVIAPDFSYKTLNIQDGDQAQLQYMATFNPGAVDNQQVYDDLWEYCRFDTYAMALVLADLYRAAASVSNGPMLL